MSKYLIATAVACSAFACALPVHALSITETDDYPGVTGFLEDAARLGVLDAGLNTVAGHMDGGCFEYWGGIDCNPGEYGIDTQDSFVIEVAEGHWIDSITVSLYIMSGPEGLGVDFSADDSNYFPVTYSPWLESGSTTPNLVLGPIGPGEYSLSMYGQSANAAGPYSVDYTIQINVATASPVPVPAAVWLFGSGLVGLVGIARRK